MSVVITTITIFLFQQDMTFFNYQLTFIVLHIEGATQHSLAGEGTVIQMVLEMFIYKLGRAGPISAEAG